MLISSHPSPRRADTPPPQAGHGVRRPFRRPRGRGAEGWRLTGRRQDGRRWQRIGSSARAVSGPGRRLPLRPS
eukprot:2224048-Prymnesium_polylepis.1